VLKASRGVQLEKALEIWKEMADGHSRAKSAERMANH